ncbi:hypothetical protein CFC21_099256 [Triticum aestivum]|uniref:TF-B3 domain-containing protein n=3 Tax=Triticum TaxID=4564 RepID=A0A9R0ZLJ8_TRITD|nr:putative B3 domain-containing protein Os03g0621600 isoform X1 [Triticum aestivum]KAF7097439.1 hypothetical protein CFC21_099256 [Triticum aestivum]VAI78967.1 unnamed protein product [Triticum turgidum subsp. durum]
MDTDMDEFSNPGCGGTGGAGCDCRDCEDYWNHDHGHAKQFLLFASDHKDFLCIPWEVRRQLRNVITDGEPIKLEAPDGQMHSVKFVKFGLITLTTGWRRFVNANRIRRGDPILFVYCGSSTFKVHICSSSSHKNSLPCSQQPPNILRAVPPHDRHVLNEQMVPGPAHVGYTISLGTWLTKEQKKKVLELADSSMRSEIPLHVAAMIKRNANEDCYVYIPLKLLDNFKEGVTEAAIQLEAHGNDMVYSVGTSKHSDDQVILQSGLSHFVASLRIQDNDLLVFRNKWKDRLEVLVLDPSGCEKTCFAMGNSSNAQEIASTSSPCTKSGYIAGRSNETSSEAPMSNKSYILPERKNLTMQQEKKVKEKVRSIGSEFPVFVKVMTARDLSKPTKLNFCVEYASACLPLEQTPLLLGLAGSTMQWPTMLTVMEYTNWRMISLLWKDFVLQTEMKAGDICLIELADRSSESLKMMVHLIRKSEMQL